MKEDKSGVGMTVKHRIQFTREECEEAWPNGPLRIIGSGNGSPSRYVCKLCLNRCQGIYAPAWTCDACRQRGKQQQRVQRKQMAFCAKV